MPTGAKALACRHRCPIEVLVLTHCRSFRTIRCRKTLVPNTELSNFSFETIGVAIGQTVNNIAYCPLNVFDDFERYHCVHRTRGQWPITVEIADNVRNARWSGTLLTTI